MKRLSFMIPVYNAEKYLDQLFKSILQQNIDNYEIIALNDGSKDRSLDICMRYQREYPEIIRVISRENKGVVRTRRELMEASKGEWLWIIDSDDYIRPEACDVLKEYMDDMHYDLIMFDHISLKNGIEKAGKQWNAMEKVEFFGEGKEKLYREFIRGSSLNTLWSKLFRRRCVDWDEDYSCYEDVRRADDKLQVIPLITNAERIVYVPSPLYYYRYVEGSLVHTFKAYTYPSITKVHKRLEEYSRRWSEKGAFDGDMIYLKQKQVCSFVTGYSQSRDVDSSMNGFRVFTNQLLTDPFYHDAFVQKHMKTGFSKSQRIKLFLMEKKWILPLYFYLKCIGCISRIRNK